MAELNALQKLVKNPRRVKLVNMIDGTVHEARDDGAAVTSDGIFPCGMRQALLGKLAKFSRGYHNDKSQEKQRVFILAERVAPMYAGDPVAATPVLNAEWQKVLDANLELRGKKLGSFVAAITGDVRSIAKTKTDKANVG